MTKTTILDKMRAAAQESERIKLSQDVTPTHDDELDEASQYMLDHPETIGPTIAEQRANPQLMELTPRCEGMPERTICQGGWHVRRRFIASAGIWVWSVYEQCPIQIKKIAEYRAQLQQQKPKTRQWT